MSDLLWFTADGKETSHESSDAAYGLTAADAEGRGLTFKAVAKQAERDIAADRREAMRLANLDGTEKPAKVIEPVPEPEPKPKPAPQPAKRK